LPNQEKVAMDNALKKLEALGAGTWLSVFECSAAIGFDP
jgi:hypothetical protein